MTPPPDSTLYQRLLHAFPVQAADHALIGLDPQGVVVGWNAGAENVLGYCRDEALGMPLRELFLAEDSARGFDRYELEVAAQDSVCEDDRWHVRKDGTRIWVTGSVSAVRAEGGSLLGFVKVMRDKTDLRAQLDRLDNQLKLLDSRRTETHAFLRTLGHELRNPLAPLQTAAHILQKVAEGPKAAAALKVVFNQLGVLRKLADDLMDLSRLTAGKTRLELQPVDLRSLLEEAALGFMQPATDQGVRLQTLLPPSPLPVQVDPPRFQQVLLNLVGNAVKFTPPGGAVWIKATQEGHEVVLQVQDTGIGIDAAVLPQIFEMFTQQQDAAQLQPSGLGIGLAMVRQLVELHGGSVQARSAGPGKGAEFSVRLPAAGSAQPT